jgi:hypothetical protein
MFNGCKGTAFRENSKAFRDFFLKSSVATYRTGMDMREEKQGYASSALYSSPE